MARPHEPALRSAKNHGTNERVRAAPRAGCHLPHRHPAALAATTQPHETEHAGEVQMAHVGIGAVGMRSVVGVGGCR